MKRLIPILLLLVASCGPLFGEEEAEVSRIDRATIRTVVSHLLTSITRKHDEIGPLFTSHLAKMKNDAAKREGFENWAEFKLGLHATSPKLEVQVANRITAHLNSLLTRPDGE